MTNKEKILCIENRLLQFFDDKKAWYTIGIVTIISILIDVLLILNQTAILEYDIGTMIAILVVIWTFTVGMSSLFFDKINNRFFGITIIDVIEGRDYVKNIVRIAWVLVIQLILMVLGVLFELRIALCADFILLMNSMIVLFLFVLINFSKTTIFYLVKEEVQQFFANGLKLKDTRFFEKVLTNFDYQNREEICLLEEVLKEQITYNYVSRLSKFKYTKFSEEEKIAFWQSYEITNVILGGADDLRFVKLLLEKWFFVEEVFVVQAGIISAVLDRESLEYFEWVKLMLACLPETCCKKLRIWISIYEHVKSLYVGKEWRQIRAANILREYRIVLNKDEVEFFIHSWYMLAHNHSKAVAMYKFLEIYGR